MALKRIAPLVTASLLALLTVVGAAGTANAATTTFRLCNYGSDYRVSASFTGSVNTTALVPPNACAEARVNAGTGFSLRVSHSNSGRVFGTYVDRTYSSGRTLVQTWASFGSFTYGKLPY